MPKIQLPIGKILRLPDGLVVVPYKQVINGWECVIVYSTNPNYKVGGYNIYVVDSTIEASSMMNSVVMQFPIFTN
jgi:hypothetical protein